MKCRKVEFFLLLFLCGKGFLVPVCSKIKINLWSLSPHQGNFLNLMKQFRRKWLIHSKNFFTNILKNIMYKAAFCWW
jgi:hypothetical protein